MNFHVCQERRPKHWCNGCFKRKLVFTVLSTIGQHCEGKMSGGATYFGHYWRPQRHFQWHTASMVFTPLPMTSGRSNTKLSECQESCMSFLAVLAVISVGKLSMHNHPLELCSEMAHLPFSNFTCCGTLQFPCRLCVSVPRVVCVCRCCLYICLCATVVVIQCVCARAYEYLWSVPMCAHAYYTYQAAI